MTAPIDDAMRKELDALLDGALPEAQATALRARIDGDVALRAEFDRRRRTVELVRGLPTEVAPDGFAASILDGLPERLATSSPGRVRSLWIWGSGLAAAAALVIAVSIGGGDPPPSDDWTLATKTEKDADVGGRSAVDLDHLDEAATRDEAKKERQTDGGIAGVFGATRTLRRENESDPSGKAARLEEVAEAKTALEGSLEGSLEEAESMSPPDAGAAQPRKRAEDRAADAPSAVLRRVEQERTVLTPAERKIYLDTLARTPQVTLAAHMDRIGRKSSTSFTRDLSKRTQEARGRRAKPEQSAYKSATVAPLAFEFAVAKRSEAEAIRKALKLAFPPHATVARKAKIRGGAVAPTVVATDESHGAVGELRLDWSVTPRQAGTMAVWFQRIGLRPAAAAAAPKPGTIRIDGARRSKADGASSPGREADDEDDGEAEREAAPPIPVRVRIRFGPRPRTPERPKGDDR